MNLRLGVLAVIFAAALAPGLAANSDPPPKVADPNDRTPGPCWEGMCPVCAKLGTLATIRACTEVIGDDKAEWSERAAAYGERGTARDLRHEYLPEIDDWTADIDLLLSHHVPVTGSFLGDAYLHRAIAYYHARRFAEAIDDLDRYGPEEMPSLHAKANWHLGNYRQALKDSESDHMMFSAGPWLTRGLIRSSLKDYPGAIADFSKATESARKDFQDYGDPSLEVLARALYQRSLVRRQTGDASGADADLAEAKATNADFNDPDDVR